MENKKDAIKKLIEKTLSDPKNMIKMLEKFGEQAVRLIDHGQLHIDHDDREPTGWNQELLKLFPLRYPVAMTSWKGCVAVSFMEEVHYFGEVGTREALEFVLEKWGIETEIMKINA